MEKREGGGRRKRGRREEGGGRGVAGDVKQNYYSYLLLSLQQVCQLSLILCTSGWQVQLEHSPQPRHLHGARGLRTAALAPLCATL